MMLGAFSFFGYSLDWHAAIEIGFLTLLFYAALYYFRSARGAQVLIGAATVIIGIWILSQQLELQVLLYFIDGMVATLGAAVAIIFQPELRRAFARLGSFTLWRGKQQRELIEELVIASTDMAKRKCGALIVVERKIGLQNLIDDAVALDSKVNAMILESIFYPNSPLHDGAVVVRAGRVVAARAILPLTKQPTISKRLGTRHRAALGISEETDAVTVVVSEETGSISIACKGHLRRDLAKEDLERFLNDLLVKHSDEAGLGETELLLEAGHEGMFEEAEGERHP